MTGSNSHIFQRPDGGKLKFAADAVSTCLEYRQDGPDKLEAGGVLLGRRIERSSDVIIDRVSVPTPRDRRSLLSFFRSHEPHQKRIDEAWKNSDGTCNYLGEWHTHPEEVPSPSCLDYWEWRRLVKKCSYLGDELFFVIVGTSRVCAWEGRRRSWRIVQLEECSAE